MSLSRSSAWTDWCGSLSGPVRLQSEQLIMAWTDRYMRGDVEADEMEEGIERALRGAPDAEWLALAHERRLGALSCR